MPISFNSLIAPVIVLAVVFNEESDLVWYNDGSKSTEISAPSILIRLPATKVVWYEPFGW